MKVSARVRVSGPLERYVVGFTAELRSHGYTDLSAANQLRLMADLSLWLYDRRIKPAELGPDVLVRFLAKRRRTHTQFVSERALAPLIRYLRGLNAMPASVPVEPRWSETLKGYEHHLAEHRAILPARRRAYLEIGDRLLAGREPRALSGEDVAAFIRSQGGMDLNATLTGLRSVLRYFFQAGETARNLVYSVPSAPRWRLSSLPKGLEKEQVDAVLSSCDRRTSVGRRDFAAILLMVRLGLRAGEVAALALDDVDWEVGEVIVRGKGGSVGRLPLPMDVGDALVAYLRRRRVDVPTRSIFLIGRAPYIAASPATIKSLAICALRAAGIEVGGAHRLRHTAATQMLRAGASLSEIAQILRHRNIDTTAIYAKVDLDRLRTLSQPWPADESPGLRHLLALAQPWPGSAA